MHPATPRDLQLCSFTAAALSKMELLHCEQLPNQKSSPAPPLCKRRAKVYEVQLLERAEASAWKPQAGRIPWPTQPPRPSRAPQGPSPCTAGARPPGGRARPVALRPAPHPGGELGSDRWAAAAPCSPPTSHPTTPTAGPIWQQCQRRPFGKTCQRAGDCIRQEPALTVTARRAAVGGRHKEPLFVLSAHLGWR